MVDFDQTWPVYKNGFGSPEADYYLGNDNLHLLTSSRPHKLRVELHHLGHGFAYAEYSTFKLGSEAENYAITVRGHTGTNSPGKSTLLFQ